MLTQITAHLQRHGWVLRQEEGEGGGNGSQDILLHWWLKLLGESYPGWLVVLVKFPEAVVPWVLPWKLKQLLFFTLLPITPPPKPHSPSRATAWVAVCELDWRGHSCCDKPHLWKMALWFKVVWFVPGHAGCHDGGTVFQTCSAFTRMCFPSPFQAQASCSPVQFLNQRQQEHDKIASRSQLGNGCGTGHSPSWAGSEGCWCGTAACLMLFFKFPTWNHH